MTPTLTPVDDVPPAAVPATPHHRRQRRKLATDAPLIVHGLVQVVGTVTLLLWVRYIWFWGDEFDLFANRVGGRHLYGVLTPHNEHWVSWLVLEYQVLYHFFGLHPFPYLVVVIAMHSLTAHLLWRVLRRASVSPWLATALSALFLFLGAGYENITWTFQVCFIGTLTCGFGALTLLMHPDGGRWRIGFASALAVASLPFCGISLPIVGMLAFVALRLHGWRSGLVVLLPAAITFAAWHQAHGTDIVPTPKVTGADLAADGGSAFQGFAGAFEQLLQIPSIGVPVGLVVLGLVLHQFAGRRDAGAVVAVGGVLASLLMYALVALDRSYTGVPTISRYAYIALGLSFPGVGLLLSGWMAAVRGRQVAVGIVTAVVLGQSFALLQTQAQVIQKRNDHARQLLQAADVVATSGDPILVGVPDVSEFPDVNASALRFWSAQGKWPSAPIDPSLLLQAKQNMETSVGPADSFETALVSSCTTVVPGQVEQLQQPPGTVAVLLAPTDDDLTLQVVDGALEAPTPEPVHLLPGVATHVLASTSLHIVLSKVTEQFQLCLPI